MENYTTTIFEKIKIGDYFTLPCHRRIYQKINSHFAKDKNSKKLYKFKGNEKIYWERDI